MEKQFTIDQSNEHSIWSDNILGLVSSLATENVCLTIEDDQRRIIVEMDRDHATTTFSSIIFNRNDYRFSIRPEGFVEDLGKLFGGQDIVLGYPEFDRKFIVKTNDEQRTEDLFSDIAARNILSSLPGLQFGIIQFITETEDGKVPFLQLRADVLITDTQILNEVYNVFRSVLLKVDV